MTCIMTTYLATCIACLKATQTPFWPTPALSSSARQARCSPTIRRQAASQIERPADGYWTDPTSIGDTPVATDRFWQVLTRARWGTHMFGVMRREALQKTSLLPNFAGSDRAMLAELALIGRFRCANESLFLKRFHDNGSFRLDHKALREFLSTDDKRYSRRLRQIKAFFGAPKGKPIGFAEQVCVLHAGGRHTASMSSPDGWHKATRVWQPAVMGGGRA